jgi:hypothetical protein
MFEKITPEEAGISSAALTKFIKLLNKRGMQMHSVLMMKGDKLFAEYYWAPFNKDFCHRMYSQTKSYTSVAIGLLEEEGKLCLDDPIAKYFPEKIFNIIPEKLAKQTIREMLTMTTVGDHARWFDYPSWDDRTKLYFNYARLEGGRAKSSENYSKGTRELFSLCARLALIDSLFEGEYPPIMLDDPFAYFDDERTKSALGLLRELGKRRQIIYFTCSGAR